MSDTLRAALLFLIDTLFNLYLFILVVRIILAWVRSDYFNPITQFVVKMTDFMVKPLRTIIPNIKQFETATFVLVIVIEMIKFMLTAWISYGFPNVWGLPILAVGDTLYLILKTFTYAIIFEVILSFLQPRSPLAQTLYRFNSPVMQPLRRIIPTIGGLDITPIPAILLLQLLTIVLVGPLMSIGQGVSFG